jgi:CheY-like chemotaxis protein
VGPELRILLAEDNPGDIYLVEEALKRQSIAHELTVVTDGELAWKSIESADKAGDGFDLYMLDLNLPARPGLELLTRIRKSRGKISTAPVVIVTSSNSTRDRAAAARAGADYYFCKPSKLEEFLKLGHIIQELWLASLAGGKFFHRSKAMNGETS